MNRPRPVPAFLLAVPAALLALAGCAQGGGSSAPQPGDSNYVPAGWTAPTLAYDKSAYLPAAVVDFKQAPGAFARNTTYRISGNTAKVLDFPDGDGTGSPNNDTLISLGMAGGYVTLRFDPALENYADAADFIVYGNAYYANSSSESVWQEPGTVWVMEDTNGNDLPDDAWYLLAPAYKATASDAWTPLNDSNATRGTVSYTYDGSAVTCGSTTYGGSSAWWPSEYDGQTTLSFDDVIVLPDSLYKYSGSSPLLRGLADSVPALIRGDLSGTGSLNVSGNDDNTTDGADDYPGIASVYFYTVPDAAGDRDVAPKSGGGSPMDIAWAVDPANGYAAVSLSSVRWVKIVSASTLASSTGDYSTEVDAVVRALKP